MSSICKKVAEKYWTPCFCHFKGDNFCGAFLLLWQMKLKKVLTLHAVRKNFLGEQFFPVSVDPH